MPAQSTLLLPEGYSDNRLVSDLTRRQFGFGAGIAGLGAFLAANDMKTIRATVRQLPGLLKPHKKHDKALYLDLLALLYVILAAPSIDLEAVLARPDGGIGQYGNHVMGAAAQTGQGVAQRAREIMARDMFARLDAA